MTNHQTAFQFFSALESADFAVVEELLKDNPALASIEFPKNVSTNPPIFVAVRVPGYNGHGEVIGTTERLDTSRSKIVSLLVDNGADPDFTYKGKVRPLHMAARYGQAKCIRVLFENGADVNSRNANGETSLFRAANLGHEEAVRELLACGADPGIRSKLGQSPLDRVKIKKLEVIMKLLQEAQQDNSDGRLRRR